MIDSRHYVKNTNFLKHAEFPKFLKDDYSRTHHHAPARNWFDWVCRCSAENEKRENIPAAVLPIARMGHAVWTDPTSRCVISHTIRCERQLDKDVVTVVQKWENLEDRKESELCNALMGLGKNKTGSYLSFCPCSALHQRAQPTRFHSLPRLEHEQKSGVISVDFILSVSLTTESRHDESQK